MPPAVVAVVAAVATVAIKAFVKSAILAAVLTLAVAAAAYLLTRRPIGATNQGQELKLKLDPTMPRQVPLGRCATGGSVVHAFTYGSSSGVPGGRYLVRIVALSDLPINGLVAVKEGKETLTFVGDVTTGLRACSSHHKTDGGQSRFYLRVYLGSPTPVADPDVISWGGGWTSSHKGVNMAYAVMRSEYDPDGNAFPQGEPQLVYILDGVSVYDDRKDGSKPARTGTHRLNSVATWEYSRNTANQIAQVLRGFYSNNVLILGAQAEERDLSDSMLLSAYNTCDETVTYSGGTQKRYESGFMANSHQSIADILTELQAAMDGRVIDRGGAITILPGATRTPIFNFTDDDIDWSEERSWQPKSTLSELYNCVTGVFADEETIFQEKQFPPLRSAAWEVDDGGERFTMQVALAAVTNWARVQRITKRIHLASRYQGTVAFTVPLWAFEMEQGDWFTVTSDRWGLTTKYFEAVTIDILADLKVLVIGRETSSAIDGWSHVVDEVARSDSTWTDTRPALPVPTVAPSALYNGDAATGVENFGVSVVLGNLGPGTLATNVQVQIAPTADLASAVDLPIAIARDQTITYYGLKPVTGYSVRARSTDGQRFSDWSAWAGFTSSAAVFGVNSSLVGSATIYADSSGVVKAGQLPKIFAPEVRRGSTSIRIADETSYSVAFTNATGSVDNTNGSASKGNITLNTLTAATGEIRLTITVGGVAQPVLKIALNLQEDAPVGPPPPSGSKTASFTTFNQINSASYIQLVASLGTVVVAAGESLYGTGTLTYQVAGGPSGSANNRTMTVKWQHSPTGAGTWTDFAIGGPDTGSASSQFFLIGPNPEGDYTPVPAEAGSVVCVQSVATPGAATYDIRAVALISSISGGTYLNVISGSLTIEAKV